MAVDVSVVIVFFNGQSTIRKTLASVFDQGMSGVEVILVDDCSDHDPRGSLGEFEQRLDVVRTPENVGPAASRNIGLRRASGRYVCFLDQDDLYQSGFFQTAVSFLDSHPAIAAVTTGIEFLDCHWEVTAAHYARLVASPPGNVMARTLVARILGGFPEGREFRGQAAGEDIAFRNALAENFSLFHMPYPFFRYRVRRGGHFDFFMQRAKLVDGRILIDSLTEEERDGSLGRASLAYRAVARARVDAMRCLLPPVAAQRELGHFFALTRTFEVLRAECGDGEATDPEEGFALYQWARHGAGSGLVLELDAQAGGPTAWLAAGCRDRSGQKLLAIANDASALAKDLSRGTLFDWVDCHQFGRSAAMPGRTIVRLLVIGGNCSYEHGKRLLDTWLGSVETCGAFALLGVGRSSGAGRLHGEVVRLNSAVKEVFGINSLRIFAQR